jgi:cytochrome P450
MKTTVLEGKTIPADTIAFMPQRPLLLSPEAFGQDAHEMNPYRFLKTKKLERSEFFRPFGSGITLCSGRIVGRQEALAFVAILLLRYDIRALKPGEKVLGVEGKPFPRVDETKPSLGVATQMKGDDLVLAVTPRKGS